MNVSHRHAVLVIARPVKAGTALRSGDLAEASLSFDSAVHVVRADERGRVVGRVAAVNLVPGTLLSLEQLSSGSVLESGQAAVGLALKPGQLPSGLKPLDHVMLVQTVASSSSVGGAGEGGSGGPTPSSTAVLASTAQVFAVEPAPDGQSTVVSVVVSTTQAPAIALQAARGQVTVVLLGGAGG